VPEQSHQGQDRIAVVVRDEDAQRFGERVRTVSLVGLRQVLGHPGFSARPPGNVCNRIWLRGVVDRRQKGQIRDCPTLFPGLPVLGPAFAGGFGMDPERLPNSSARFMAMAVSLTGSPEKV